MPLAGYTAHDDAIEFHRDDGTSFALPKTPETVAEAARLDGGAKGLDFYRGLAAPMATSPDALAMAPSVEMAGGGGAMPPPAPPAGAPSQGPPLGDYGSFSLSKPIGQWLDERKAVRGTADEVQGASLSAARQRDMAAGVTPTEPGLSMVPARPAPEAPPPAPAPPGQIDPSARLTLPAARGAGGAPGGGGYQMDPLLAQELARASRAPVVIGRSKAGFQSQGKVVEGEAGPSAQSFDDVARASESVVDLKGALAREDAKATEGKVTAQDEAIVRAEAARTRALEGFDAADRDVQRLRTEVEKGEVDPGRFWTRQGAFGQLTAALSIVAGQIGAAMMKSDKNIALDIINKYVDDDIAAQVHNLSSKRAALGDAERQFDLNIKRLGSLQTAIDYERLQKHQLVDAHLAKLELKAQGDDEQTGQIGLIRAQNSQRIAELAMSIDAKKAGTVKETLKYNPGGAIYAPGSGPLTFAQRAELRKEAREDRKLYQEGTRTEAQNVKDLREAQAPGAVVRGQDVELPGYEKGEGEKARKALAAADELEELTRRRDQLNTLGTRLTFDKQAELDQINAAIGARLSTFREMGVQGETERQQFDKTASSYLAGKGTSGGILSEVETHRKSILRQGRAQFRAGDGKAVRIKVD